MDNQFDPMISQEPVMGSDKPAVFGIIVGLVALIVLAGGAFAAYTYLGGGDEQSDDVIVNMVDAMKDVTSVAVDAQMDIAVADDVNGNVDVSGSYVAKIDMKDTEDPKADMSITGDVNMSGPEGDLSARLSLDIKALSKKAYIRLNDISLTMENQTSMEASFAGAMVDMYAEQLSGKWIVADAAAGEEFGADLGALEDQEEIQEVIFDEFKQSELLSDIESKGMDKVNGENSYHYGVTINFVKLVDFAEGVTERLVQEGIITSEEAGDYGQDFAEGRENAKDLADMEFEMWIDEDDYYLRKIVFAPYTAKPEDAAEVTFSGTLVLDQFNEEFEIVAPEGAQPLEELMQQMLGGMMGSGEMMAF